MFKDDVQDPFNRNYDVNRNIPNYKKPPEDQPDDGMSTAREDALMGVEIPPELKDGGMSAGYPPLRDDDLLPEPSVPVVKPEPSSMRDAPIFSPYAFEFPEPGPVLDGGASPTQDEDSKDDAQKDNDVKKAGEK